MRGVQIVGRDRELAELAVLLGRAADGPTHVVLSGGAGIGKTTLWRAGVELARQRGWRVLACRAAETEGTLPYAALCDLLGEFDDEELGDLPDPQRHALEVALLRRPGGSTSPEPLAISLAVLSTVLAAARHSGRCHR